MSEAISEITDTVRAALDHIGHPEHRPIVIALSGGIDSQVLAHALRAITHDTSYELHAVHIDHQLREESTDDANRVRSVCESWGMPCDVVTIDVEPWDIWLKQGTESAARHARYAGLARAALEHETNLLVMGHTLDDQVETVMLKLLSGTGLEGLSGMPEVTQRTIALEPGHRGSKRFTLFRPLLGISRAQIEAYAGEVGIAPIEDSTNTSLVYRRNALRHSILPSLAAIEPAVRESVSRTARLLQDDARFIADAMDETYAEVVAEREGIWMLDRKQFDAAHIAVQRRILYRVLETALPVNSRLTLERIEALRSAAIDGKTGKIIELAGDVVGYVDYDRVAIGNVLTLEDTLRRLSWVPLIDPGTEIPLQGDVDVQLSNGWRVRGHVPNGIHAVLRTRRDGDRTRVSRGHQLKLQDWLVNQKVPRYLRDWLPVVEIDEEIRWVIGFAMTEYHHARSGVHLFLDLDTTGNNAGSQND